MGIVNAGQLALYEDIQLNVEMPLKMAVLKEADANAERNNLLLWRVKFAGKVK